MAEKFRWARYDAGDWFALAIEAPWLICSPMVRLGFAGNIVSDMGPLGSFEEAQRRAQSEVAYRTSGAAIVCTVVQEN